MSTSSLAWKHRISPMSMRPEPGPLPSSTTWCSRHSICTGDSATSAGLTKVAGRGVKPDFTNSSTPSAYSAEATFICCTMAWLTVAMTNSFMATTFWYVCLVVPSRPRRLGAKANMGGLDPKALKKEKGARLRTPALLTVEANAMGRGAMLPTSQALVWMGLRSEARTVRMLMLSWCVHRSWLR